MDWKINIYGLLFTILTIKLIHCRDVYNVARHGSNNQDLETHQHLRLTATSRLLLGIPTKKKKTVSPSPGKKQLKFTATSRLLGIPKKKKKTVSPSPGKKQLKPVQNTPGVPKLLSSKKKTFRPLPGTRSEAKLIPLPYYFPPYNMALKQFLDKTGNFEAVGSPYPTFTVEWPYGIVPYYIDGETYDETLKRRIQKAMASIESSSCVIFKEMFHKPQMAQVTPWLHFSNLNQQRECSHDTIQGDNSDIIIILGIECLKSRDVLHSVLHGLGFNDEVSHPHRDQYIRILWENIQPKYRPLFRVRPDKGPYKLVEYDPMSIMHFYDRAYSDDGKLTIAPVMPGLVITPSDKLSQLDVMKLRIMFGHECNKRKVNNLIDNCKNVLYKRNTEDEQVTAEDGDKELSEQVTAEDDDKKLNEPVSAEDNDKQLNEPVTAEDNEKQLNEPVTAEDNDKKLKEPVSAEDNDKQLNEPVSAEDNDKQLNEPVSAEDNDKQLNEQVTAEDDDKQLNEPVTAEDNDDKQKKGSVNGTQKLKAHANVTQKLKFTEKDSIHKLKAKDGGDNQPLDGPQIEYLPFDGKPVSTTIGGRLYKNNINRLH